MFGRVLVANRGEIALRVMRTCRKLGVETVAVYSDADAASPHVRFAERSVRIGPPPVKDSYLNVDAIVTAARETGAEAIHPGYGLLSENEGFALAVAAAGIVFIGPPPAALEAFGDKLKARALARSVGVEPPAGSDGPIDPADLPALRAIVEKIGLPVLFKAAGGGGGIGMQLVRDFSELEKAARACSDRGRAAFGDARVYVERYLESPRHIEVQIVRDRAGTRVALPERECSVQRRHQKIIEESPSPAAFYQGEEGSRRRHALAADALKVVDAADYEGAGTVEFVADRAGTPCFLEVNARLQVEHPVTEMISGVDLVAAQLRIASGESLPNELKDVVPSGHAIEARVYAEDPAKGFIPQPGRVERLAWPAGLPGVRIDAGIEEGGEVTPYYDPMIAKVIAHGRDRAEAIERLQNALHATELRLVGPKGPRATNLAFLMQVLADSRFVAGTYDTSLAEAIARGA
ncbi:MAG TPA: biotin carboxylase N-terminal domain-containing protein [Polyangiaceae bacterium]|nr:biotin carboxylase N-terminal domain-containing protein [Polyangiaceae bacterium]